MVTRRPGEIIPIHEVKRLCVSKVEEDKFSFVWTLKDFTRPVGEIRIHSPTFRGGKPYYHEWTVCVQNVMQNCMEYLGVFLCLKKCGAMYPLKTVKAGFHMSIIDLNGRILKTQTSLATEYAAMSPGFGFSNFVTIHEILNPMNNYLVNGGKDLQLFFEVITETESQTSHQPLEMQPIPTHSDIKTKSLEVLSKQMQQFLPGSDREDLDGHDLEIVSGEGTKFPAFSNILSARSPVFKAMFKSCMKETLTKTITIRDFPDDVIRGFLEYLYTAQTDVIKSNPIDLMRLADQYEVLLLVRNCEYQLGIDLTIENATETFLLARLYSLAWLKPFVSAFIRRNEKAVMKTESFERAKKDNPAAVVELYTLLHSE